MLRYIVPCPLWAGCQPLQDRRHPPNGTERTTQPRLLTWTLVEFGHKFSIEMDTYPRRRVVLSFEKDADAPEAFRRHLSGCAFDQDGDLWVCTDELNGLSRLVREVPGIYSKHDYTDLNKRLQLPDKGEEIDLEGLDIQGDDIWFVGSHASTRKKVKKGKTEAENLSRLTEVKSNPNRCLIGRARLSKGKIASKRDVAQVPIQTDGNALTEGLQTDPHLGAFLRAHDPQNPSTFVQLASKENGFDVEGIAAYGHRIFLGLRGPVLRGWAMLIEVRVTEANDTLTLDPIGHDGRPYRKHFVDLNGMGVRDLTWFGDDLVLLAGPSMDITGLQSVYVLRDAADLSDDSLTLFDGSQLQRQCDLPQVNEGDKAEGICSLTGSGIIDVDPGILVVYDSPRTDRLIDNHAVLADAFALKPWR